MVQKLVVAVVLCASLSVAGCNTVRGAAADVGSAANCTQNAMHGGSC